MIERFEVKIINTTEFNDYLNLSSKPMFLNIDEKKKNLIGKEGEHRLGILFLDVTQKGFIKINSLGALANELRKHSFIFDDKWEKRAKFIQALLYP